MRRLLRDCAGGVLIEAALVLPVLFAVLFGAIECGQLMWTHLALDYAVEEAARCAEVTPSVCKDNKTTAAYAQSRALPLTLPPAAITVSNAPCGTQVKGQLSYSPILGSFVMPDNLTLKAQVCRPTAAPA